MSDICSVFPVWRPCYPVNFKPHSPSSGWKRHVVSCYSYENSFEVLTPRKGSLGHVLRTAAPVRIYPGASGLRVSICFLLLAV